MAEEYKRGFLWYSMIRGAIQLVSKGAHDIAKLSHSPTLTDGWNRHREQIGVQTGGLGIELQTFRLVDDPL